MLHVKRSRMVELSGEGGGVSRGTSLLPMKLIQLLGKHGSVGGW